MGKPAFYRLTEDVSHGLVKHFLSIVCEEDVGKMLLGIGKGNYTAIAE